jgi:hypothetical protein
MQFFLKESKYVIGGWGAFGLSLFWRDSLLGIKYILVKNCCGNLD